MQLHQPFRANSGSKAHSNVQFTDRGLKAHSGSLQLARRYPSKGHIPKSMSCWSA